MIMSAMREKTKIVLFAVLIAFVGFIFFQWGMDMTRRNPTAGAVGRVNGRDITVEAYQKTRQQVAATYEQRAGHSAAEQDAEAIEEDTWIALVREALLQEQVEKYGIGVTDAEILEVLKTNPPDMIRAQFVNDKGEFDVASYQRALSDPSLAPQWASVESYLRTTMPADKLQNYISLNARVTSGEVHERFVSRNEKVRVSYVASPASAVQLPADAMTEEKARAYYDGHPDEFKVGEQAVLEFVRSSKAPTAEDTLDVREDLEKVRGEILGGADFADLARTWSDDNSGQNGGDLGFFGRGQMVPEFEKVAFATPVGQVSEVFSTGFGFHILKVEERKKENGQELVHARHILLKVAPSEETTDAAVRVVDDFLDAVQNGKEWSTAAADLGLTVEKTPPFERGSAIPGIGRLRAADVFAFTNPAGTVAKEPIEDAANAYGFRLVERRPPGLAAYDDVKDRAKSLVVEAERKDAARKRLADAIGASNGTLEGIAKAMGARVDTTGAFTRESFLPGVGRKNTFVATAFSLEPGKVSPLVDSERGFYVLEVTEKLPADEALFAQQRDELRRQLLQEKRQLLVTTWLETLVAQAKVVDYRSGKAVDWKPDPSMFSVIRPVS